MNGAYKKWMLEEIISYHADDTLREIPINFFQKEFDFFQKVILDHPNEYNSGFFLKHRFEKCVLTDGSDYLDQHAEIYFGCMHFEETSIEGMKGIYKFMKYFKKRLSGGFSWSTFWICKGHHKHKYYNEFHVSHYRDDAEQIIIMVYLDERNKELIDQLLKFKIIKTWNTDKKNN